MDVEGDNNAKMRIDAVEVIKSIEFKPAPKEMCKYRETIKKLRERKESIYYTKADKSNNVVILNGEDYIQSTEDSIAGGPYEMVDFDPLPGMVRRTKEAVKGASNVFDEDEHFTLKMHVSNPIIPRLYVQRKLHKPGQKVRPITPNNNAPTEKLAVWLLNIFKKMPIKFESASIKNSNEFVNKIENVKMAANAIQASFDVESLFPSVPIETTFYGFVESEMRI